MIKIDPNFWKDVENPEKLKYVVYGDSIAENEEVLVGFKKENYSVKLISFKDLWNILSQIISTVIKDEKEYLYINDEIKISTYIDKKDCYMMTTPLYLVRHYIKKDICKLNFENYPSISVTYDHSLLTYDYESDLLQPIKPNDSNYAIVVDNYYTNILNQYRSYTIFNIKRVNASALEIKSKHSMYYDGYVYDFSVPDTENFIVNGIIVHNTDSLYIHAPNQEYTSAEEALTKADDLANEINSIITNILNSHLLIKMNVDRNYNKTFFKTESVISKMMLLEAKKNYAYLELGKKGKINKEPKVKYTGIPVVRSDYSKFAQDFIRYLVEDVAFSDLDLNNNTISDKMVEIIENKQNELEEHLKNYNFRYIATPGRWKLNASYKLEPFVVIGMRLYNTLLDQEIFRPGINGLSIPIKIINEFKFREEISKNAHRSKYFIGGTPINKINYIVVPTNYENDVIKEKFVKYCIRPDNDVIWEKSFGTVAKNIAKVIRSHYEQL